jgi:hypothetical protein
MPALRRVAPNEQNLKMADKILPLAEAVKRIDGKTPIGSRLRSKEWEEVPLALRERAQFSAGVTSAKLLQTIQDRLSDEINQRREALANGKEAMFDRSSFIDAVREIAREEGLTPEQGRGSITDITSIPRLGMVYDMQNQMATGFARWKMDQDEGALLLYPAWRLVREREARVPRDWRARWAEAGEAVGWEGALESPMVALKTSGIWSKLSRFGTPWPPFDYNSGMGVEDVERDEAVELGLSVPDGPMPDGERGFNEELEASVRDLDAPILERLRDAFKGQIKIGDGKVEWRGKSAQKAATGASKTTLAQATEDLKTTSAAEEVLFKAPSSPRIWGAQIVSKELRLEHTQALKRGYEDLRARFPNMPKPTHTLLVVASKRGRATLDGPKPMLSTKAKEFSDYEWKNVEAWEKANNRKWTAERRGQQVQDNLRHEICHNLTTPEVLQKWERTVLRQYDLEWFRQNVSEYCARDGKSFEALAETFSLCTRSDYKRGGLPIMIEEFIFREMLKEQ